MTNQHQRSNDESQLGLPRPVCQEPDKGGPKSMRYAAVGGSAEPRCALFQRWASSAFIGLAPTDRLRLDSGWSGGINNMNGDDDWKVAEAALEKARGLPGGAERIEALKQAGRLRFEADRISQKKEVRQYGPSSRLGKPTG